MNTLIISSGTDAHAQIVQWALRKYGQEPVLWAVPDFPSQQQGTLFISPSGRTHVVLEGSELSYAGQPFDVVWARRFMNPVLPPNLHPADLPYAQRECEAFLNNARRVIAPGAFWVNSLRAQPAAMSKAVQLKTAAQCGLVIPDTLMSNHPAHIREFVARHGEATIFKPFFQAHWQGDTTLASLLTNTVSLKQLEDDFAVSSCPGIYQRRCEKAYEVRLTVIGEHLFAAKLLSQETAATAMDYRGDLARSLRVEPIDLPAPVDLACRKLMAALGLVFGCLDFIVTPDGDYIFLEVNEMGQFLWVEECCPELKLLDAFTQLLIAGRPDFPLTPSSRALAVADYMKSDTYAHDRKVRPTWHAARAPAFMKE